MALPKKNDHEPVLESSTTAARWDSSPAGFLGACRDGPEFRSGRGRLCLRGALLDRDPVLAGQHRQDVGGLVECLREAVDK
ncbi:hypothetical protein [Streptomyces sp. NPDC085529]|uniref:hypothetical protein n=1 Tax=Streptomyces sp. NPDC085529 TaxID=3365729 RepID=UPI0037CEC265